MRNAIFGAFSILSLIVSGGVLVQSVFAEDPAVPLASRAPEPLSDGFTFQGRLVNDGIPHEGFCDFEFTLWSDALATGAAQVGGPDQESAVTVRSGLFTVLLNAGGEFGLSAFNGEKRWVETAVRCPSGSGLFTTLTPRSEVTSSPNALALRLPHFQSGSTFDTALLNLTNTNIGPAILARGGANGIAGLTTVEASSSLNSFVGPGAGVFGSSNSAGVVGLGDVVGVFGGSLGTGVSGAHHGGLSGAGVYGSSDDPGSPGVHAVGSGITAGSQGSAIVIGEGAIVVSNAGLNTNTPVFQHEATFANTAGPLTCIDHPLINGRADAILIITRTGSTGIDSSMSVFYGAPSWCIFRDDSNGMPAGTVFNVLVILP